MAVKNPFTAISPDSENYSRLFLRDEELQIGLAAIFEAAAKLKNQSQTNRERLGFNWSDAKVLVALGAKPDSVLNLALRLDVTKQALTKTLRTLEQNGLLARQTDRRDKRRQILNLTELGKEKNSELGQDMRALLTRAYRQSGAEAVYGSDQVLWALLETPNNFKRSNNDAE